MHRPILMLCACILLAHAPNAFALGLLDDESAGWTWRGGLLGNDSFGGDVFAADELIPGYLCDECRDPAEHPMDFVAAAYNGYFGEDPWMRDTLLGTPFRIYNLDGQWVVVWFEGVVFDVSTLLPDTMDVRLRLPDGRIVTFSVLQGGPGLPIGNPDPLPPPSGSCGCGDDDNDDQEDNEWGDGYADPDEGLPEPPEAPEYSGEVSIVDPDEDGGFPEWDM